MKKRRAELSQESPAVPFILWNLVDRSHENTMRQNFSLPFGSMSSWCWGTIFNTLENLVTNFPQFRILRFERSSSYFKIIQWKISQIGTNNTCPKNDSVLWNESRKQRWSSKDRFSRDDKSRVGGTNICTWTGQEFQAKSCSRLHKFNWSSSSRNRNPAI